MSSRPIMVSIAHSDSVGIEEHRIHQRQAKR